MLKRILILIISLLLSLISNAQKQTLSGQIIDEGSRQGVPFATLLIKNTIYGVQADENGYYTLELPKGYEKDSISVSSLSYAEKTFAVKDMKPKQLIELKLDGMLLDEVVVYPVDPYDIMKMAAKNRDKNHRVEDSQVQECFSRELFFDKGQCFRVGESIIDIHTFKLSEDSIRKVKEVIAARAIQDSSELWTFNDMLRLKRDTVSLDYTFAKGLSGIDVTTLFHKEKKEEREQDKKKRRKRKKRGINLSSKLDHSLKYNGTVSHHGRTTHRILAELHTKDRVVIKGQLLIDSATYAFAGVQLANQNVDLYKEFVPWYAKVIVRVMGYKPVFNRLSFSSAYQIGKNGKWHKSYDFLRYGGKISKRKGTIDGYVQTEYYYQAPKATIKSFDELRPKKDEEDDFQETVVSSFEDKEFWSPRKGIETPNKVLNYAKLIHNKNQKFEGSIGYNKKESKKRRREMRKKRRAKR